jgi:hypothetical protein
MEQPSELLVHDNLSLWIKEDTFDTKSEDKSYGF